MFAIAASSQSDWLENLKQIKETIHSVLETYSMDVIRGGVILFGKDTKAIDIQQTLSKDLQMAVNKLFPKVGDLDLDNALKESRRLFKNTGRPNARKVLVVISDKASGSTYNDVKIEADLLKEEDIVLISVVIGQEADTKELIDFTPFNVTKTTTEEDPKELAKKIIVLVLTGEIIFLLFSCLLLLIPAKSSQWKPLLRSYFAAFPSLFWSKQCTTG